MPTSRRFLFFLFLHPLCSLCALSAVPVTQVPLSVEQRARLQALKSICINLSETYAGNLPFLAHLSLPYAKALASATLGYAGVTTPPNGSKLCQGTLNITITGEALPVEDKHLVHKYSLLPVYHTGVKGSGQIRLDEPTGAQAVAMFSVDEEIRDDLPVDTQFGVVLLRAFDVRLWQLVREIWGKEPLLKAIKARAASPQEDNDDHFIYMQSIYGYAIQALIDPPELADLTIFETLVRDCIQSDNKSIRDGKTPLDCGSFDIAIAALAAMGKPAIGPLMDLFLQTDDEAIFLRDPILKALQKLVDKEFSGKTDDWLKYMEENKPANWNLRH